MLLSSSQRSVQNQCPISTAHKPFKICPTPFPKALATYLCSCSKIQTHWFAFSQMCNHLPDSTSCQCCSQYYCYLANDYGSFHLQWFDLVWWSWGWNPGPCQCLASVLPLRYIPSLRPLPANGLKSLPTHFHLYGWALLRLCFLNQMWSLRASTGTFIFFSLSNSPFFPWNRKGLLLTLIR